MPPLTADGTFYTPTWTTPTITTATTTAAYEPITYGPIVSCTTFVTNEDLLSFASKIYKIIEEHTRIDISEDEFIKLVKEGE